MKLMGIFFLVFVFLVTPKVFAQKSVDSVASDSSAIESSYDLFYPIVSGKVPGERFYFLKSLREWFVGKIVFDDIRKSDFHLTLSKKRLVEGEALIQKNDYPRAQKSIEKSTKEYKKAVSIAQGALEKGKPAKDIINALKTDGRIEVNFLDRLIKNLPDNEAESFRPLLNDLRSLAENVDT